MAHLGIVLGSETHSDIADLDGGSVAEITFPNPNNLTSFKVKVRTMLVHGIASALQCKTASDVPGYTCMPWIFPMAQLLSPTLSSSPCVVTEVCTFVLQSCLLGYCAAGVSGQRVLEGRVVQLHVHYSCALSARPAQGKQHLFYSTAGYQRSESPTPGTRK